ncbi:DEKNAAC100198 [Brettanomyces naardenensis]|uniref:DEKNAAC100198 n=1 Tax=Brettanomyces naardenensis TaxID=13370 RepID=A0A448YG36_BRENA|nr:DEKNAAC100198 [Brettanomyces naardenensis]
MTTPKNVQFANASPNVFYRHDSESALYSTDEEADDFFPKESPELQSLRRSLKGYTIGGDNFSFSGQHGHEHEHELEHEQDLQEDDSTFNRWPLSDTPVVSGSNSPVAYSPLVLSDEDDDEFSEDENDKEETQRKEKKLRHETEENTEKNRQIPFPEPVVSPNDEVERVASQIKEKYSLAHRNGTLETTTEKLVVVMVGLPARGKSYISKKLVRYLNWLQISSKIFNVGSTRRAKSKQLGPSNAPLPDGRSGHVSPAQDASFFSPTNKESVRLREEWARETLDHLIDYLLNHGGCVGVFDATNTTVNRRKMVFDTIMKRGGGKLQILYLESICNDKRIIDGNIRLKLEGPDYKDMDRETALADFKGRLVNYEKAYETISEEEEKNMKFQYIQMIDVGRKVIACNIRGFIPSQVIYYFLNFNLSKRLTFVSRHGESTDNMTGRIGGDAPLTERGRRFALALERFVDSKKKEFRARQLAEYHEKLDERYYKEIVDAGELEPPEEPSFQVMSSMLKRSMQTAEYFPDTKYEVKMLRALDELGSGNFDGMTYQEIQENYPEEFAARLADKMTYRYPGVGGESYMDVINRLKPIINEMERSTCHMLVITHRVVSRILLAYFLNLKREAIGELDVPLHAVYVFEPQPFGVEWKLYEYSESKDWFFEVDPNKLENSKKVRQVGISYRERKYSVVPTAPKRMSSSTSPQSTLGGVRSSLREFARAHRSQANNSSGVSPRISQSNVVENLQRARGIPRPVGATYRNPFGSPSKKS